MKTLFVDRETSEKKKVLKLVTVFIRSLIGSTR